MYQGVGVIFAERTASQLIRVARVIPKATRKHRQNAGTDHREASESAFLNFFSSFVSLSLSLSLLLSPSIMLCRTPCTILGRGGKKEKKKEEKWVRATYFFFPQFTEAEGGGVIVS